MQKLDLVDVDGEVYASLNPEYARKLLKENYERALKKSNIPEFYYNIEFNNYQGTQSKRSLIKVMNYSEKCFTKEFDYMHLYLWGENASQKTSCGINILKKAIRQGKKVKFILAYNLINKLMKNQGFNYHKDIQNYLKELISMDMILIDDVFCDKKSIMWSNSDNKGLIISEWDGFLRDLFVSKTKVILTSNTSPNSIEQYFGSSMYHLIDNSCYPLHFMDIIKQRKKNFKNLLD